jgi:hypothetical protein
MDRVFTPENLIPLFKKIEKENLDLILVGGQAINIWANHYVNRVPKLLDYLPFSSADLDFYGGKFEAATCQEILGGIIKLNQNFDPSPNTGVLIVPTETEPLRIDFLGSVFGIGDVELSQSAINFKGKNTLLGLNLRILNPILCLEGKLKTTNGLDQKGRQDLKHLKMALLFVKEYIKDTIEQDIRQGLKLIERIAFNSWSDAGLNLWYHQGVELELAIPTGLDLENSDPKWSKFQEIRLLQIREEIAKKRERYQKIQDNLALRVEAKQSNQPRQDLDI